MDFDWSSPKFPLQNGMQQEIEEAFEDPFSIRLLPDSSNPGPTRYVLLGKSVSGNGMFCVFRTDGKNYRVVVAREMSEQELAFYERKNAEAPN